MRSAVLLSLEAEQGFAGHVVATQRGIETGEKLYMIQYSDGELQHLTEEQVREQMVSDE